MSGSTEPAPGQPDPAKTVPPPGYTVPARPDGWPNLLGRRPMSSTDRAKIREALATGLPASALASPGPFLCYLTIDGLDQEPDPQKATRLRGRINAAARTAAEQHQTSYHATDATHDHRHPRIRRGRTDLPAPPRPRQTRRQTRLDVPRRSTVNTSR